MDTFGSWNPARSNSCVGATDSWNGPRRRRKLMRPRPDSGVIKACSRRAGPPSLSLMVFQDEPGGFFLFQVKLLLLQPLRQVKEMASDRCRLQNEATGLEHSLMIELRYRVVSETPFADPPAIMV